MILVSEINSNLASIGEVFFSFLWNIAKKFKAKHKCSQKIYESKVGVTLRVNLVHIYVAEKERCCFEKTSKFDNGRLSF